MLRDLGRLESEEYDLLVIGAGIQGACIAWDAALRGLRVALVERDDVGAATSANSLRIIHGGLRYLARGDFPRMRESIRERTALLRIAPGLVEPLPVLIPTGPSGVPSRLALGAALGLTHVLSPRRNRDLLPSRRIGAGRLLSRDECLTQLPALASAQVTGGALWYDARMTHPERLTLAFVLSAADKGAVAANHAEAEAFDLARGAIHAVEVVDRLSGRRHIVRARQVVIAAGPWTEDLVARAGGRPSPPAATPRQAFGMNLILGRRLGEAAVGLRAVSSSDADPGGSGGRFLFTVPQERTTLLGTWYAVADGEDPDAALDRGEEFLLEAANRACPGLRLTPEDVIGRQVGRLPLKAGLERGSALALAERPRVRRAPAGPSNLLAVEGVKYTTARAVAEHVVDGVLASLGLEPRACRTAVTPLVGGAVSTGARAPLELRVRRAVTEEMAATLSDVVFRRTELGEPPGPDEEDVRLAARIAGDALGWDDRRRSEEEAMVLRAEAV
ncbi:MAG TPA: FAD-dependent oxidoreductase [Gemmatimonadales bacterium]|nr:FAD-dependent oxidoreductase [Gemmatimonadales bacterium]